MTNTLISNSTNITHKISIKYQIYNDIQKKINNPFFEKPSDYVSKIDLLCSIHPNQKESEQVLRMFDCDINKSIDYFLNPTSFFNQTVHDEQILIQMQKSTKKKNKKYDSEIVQDYIAINKVSYDMGKKGKKRKKRRSLSSNHSNQVTQIYPNCNL